MVRCSSCSQDTPASFSHCVHCGAALKSAAMSTDGGDWGTTDSPEKDVHTLSFHLDDMDPVDAAALQDFGSESNSEIDAHTLFLTKEDAWKEGAGGSFSDFVEEQHDAQGEEERQGYAFRKLKLLKKPGSNRNLFREQTMRKKFDAEEWEAIVAEATQQKVPSPVAHLPTGIPGEPPPEEATRVASVVSSAASAHAPEPTIPSTSAGTQVTPVPLPATSSVQSSFDSAIPGNDATQKLSDIKAWVEENQHLFEEESQEFPTTTVGPTPVVHSPPPTPATSEPTQVGPINPFLRSTASVQSVFQTNMPVHQPEATERVDLHSMVTTETAVPRKTTLPYTEAVPDSWADEEVLEELDEASIVEDEQEDIQTQQRLTPRHALREKTIPGGMQNLLMPFANQEDDPQSTLVHRSPRRQQELICLVLLQLHVEKHDSHERFHYMENLSLLDGLSYQFAEILKDAGLQIDVEREDQLIAHAPCSQQTLKQAFEHCTQVLQLVRRRQNRSRDARARVRCVVTTGEGNRIVALESARNSALRLLEAMPSDTIWGDSRSWFDLQHTFTWQDLDLHQFEMTVHELQVQEEETPQQLSPTPQHLPLLGRQSEWAQLQEMWEKTSHGRSSLAFVVGEAGTGRSRLVEEWRSSLPQEHTVFLGGARWCPKTNVQSPYLTGLLESHKEAEGWSNPGALMNSLSQLAEEGRFPMQGWREYGSDLLGLWENYDQRGRDPAEALTWYIELCTRRQPVLLVLDDLFLLDRSAHRWLDSLLEKSLPRLMMVVITSTGEYESRFFQVLQAAVTLELKSLSEQESLQLIHQVAQDRPEVLPRSMTLIRESQGNPRLLLSLLAASFQTEQDNEEETLMDHVSIPSAMEATVLQKLRGLDYLEQDTLRKAAVVGERFWKGAIESLERLDLSEGGWGLKGGQFVSRVDDRQETLHKLVRRQLIVPVDKPVLGQEVEYRFSQRLLQQVLLQQYPPAIRRKMHKKIAEWLLLRGRSPALARDVAMHLKRAGEVSQASVHLSMAGESALAEHNYAEALRLLREALEGTPEEGSALRLKLLRQLGKVYRAMGDGSSAIHLYKMALKLSWRLSSFVDGGILYQQLGLCHLGLGQFEKARDAFINGIALLEQVEAKNDAGLLYLNLAKAYLLQGQSEEAQQPLEEARRHLDESEPVQQARFLLVEGHYFRLKAHWARAISAFQEACRLLREERELMLLAEGLAEQGELFLTAGDEETAAALLQESADILGEHHSGTLLVRVLLLMARASMVRRDSQAALETLQKAWNIVQRLSDPVQTLEVAAALSAVHASALKAKMSIHFARIAEKKVEGGTPLQQAMVQFYLGQAAATLPTNLIPHMLERPPRKLPDGGLATYFYVRALEMFEKSSEKARYCMALLALGRSLLRSKHQQAARNVLTRGLREAKTHGLGLWLERLENQLRLVQGGEETPVAPASSKKDTSTLLVRTPKKRKGAESAFPKKENKSSEDNTRQPLRRKAGGEDGRKPRSTEAFGSFRQKNHNHRKSSTGIPRPNSPPPKSDKS